MSATTRPRTGSAPPISDVVTGVYAFQAIATTLFARATVGTGRWIDVNLCQSTAALLGHKVAEHVLEGGAPRALNVPAGSYQTSDGWMMVTLVNEPQYKRLCAAIEREDLAERSALRGFRRPGRLCRCADIGVARGVPDPADGSLAFAIARGRYHRRAHPQSRRVAAQRPCRGDQGRRSARIRPASVRSTRRVRRVSPVFPKTDFAPRRISDRIAWRSWRKPDSIATPSMN